MTDETATTKDTTEPTEPAADGTLGSTGEGTPESADQGATSTAREWLSQLQSMIENVTEQAGPVLRDVSAKAAELAAAAGEKAGPVAARAAELTAEAGSRIAERSRDLAAELRRDQAARQADASEAADPGTATASEPDPKD
jgi:hypothetical protein